jgi:hypothetical protein
MSTPLPNTPACLTSEVVILRVLETTASTPRQEALEVESCCFAFSRFHGQQQARARVQIPFSAPTRGRTYLDPNMQGMEKRRVFLGFQIRKLLMRQQIFSCVRMSLGTSLEVVVCGLPRLRTTTFKPRTFRMLL